MAPSATWAMRGPRARRSAFFAKVRLDETLTRDYGEIAQSNTNE